MCLALYLATDAPVSPGTYGKLTIEEPKQDVVDELRRVFSKPSIRHIGVAGGCSCPFRHVLIEAALLMRDATLAQEDDADSQQSTTAMAQLLELVRDQLPSGVELYPVFFNESTGQVEGRQLLNASGLQPERFFFVEKFLYDLRS